MSKANPFQQFVYKGVPAQQGGAASPEAAKPDRSLKVPVTRKRPSQAEAGAPAGRPSMPKRKAEKSGAENSANGTVPKGGGAGASHSTHTEGGAKRARTGGEGVGQTDTASGSFNANAVSLLPDVQARCRALLEIAEDLAKQLQPLRFKAPVTHVYNPLQYAMRSYVQYVTRYGGRPGVVLLVGLNPGPWGMAQTGVPFGDCSMVKDFLGITAPVGQPAKVHPKRLVYGFSCPYKEVSGQRIWGWARDRYKEPEAFFDKFYVMNYCPLAFMEGPNGKLRTPDKLPAAERDAVVRICDEALRRTIETIRPKLVVGIGQYTSERVRKCAGNVKTGTVMHPSPANPATNAGWAGIAERQLNEMGVDLG